jgi:hypothetical protein
MAQYTDQFRLLVAAYRDASIAFPQLKPVTVAQWMLESGRGDSKLATDYDNYAGLKWREEMQGFATPVNYQAHDGTDRYCKFTSIETFISGYWHFLERAPYLGWRDHADSGVHFIRFIGPIYTPTGGYAAAVEGLIPEAEALLASSGNVDSTEHHNPDDTHGSSERPAKPAITQFIASPFFSSRNGERIRRIIMHYTDSRNVQGTIAWFQDPRARVSAHYVIGRNGEIYQMVRDSDKAWHAKGANADSIGIEHSAASGDAMTAQQTLSSVQLVRWLLSEYKLPKTSIYGHKYTPENAGTTNCPDHLFGQDSEAALNQWVQANI